MEEKTTLIMLQTMQNEAAIESLASILLSEKKYTRFQEQKIFLVEEKLQGMIEQLNEWKKDIK